MKTSEMPTTSVALTLPRLPLEARPSLMNIAWSWPTRFWIFAVAATVVYAPTLRDAANVWMTNDNYAHGVFIFPLAAYLIWKQRSAIKTSVPNPKAWGVGLVFLGLSAQCAGYLLCIRYIGMWSLILTLAGGILALHGPALWKISRFPVGFLLFAAPMPHAVLRDLTLWIQFASTSGAACLMYWLGYPLIQHGNVIEIPGISVQVAEACSGFHKLVSLAAITMLYAHIRGTSRAQSIFMLSAVVPLALAANVLRICGLIAVAYKSGTSAAHSVHDLAELLSIGLAFGGLVAIERSMGWRISRRSPVSAL